MREYFWLFFIVIVLLVSCSKKESYKTLSKSTWVIVQVENIDNVKSAYQAELTSETNLNACNKSWFIDSIDLFELGDTICFKKI